MQLPQLLRDPNDQRAVNALSRYYGTHGQTSRYTGSFFDTWDSAGTRLVDCDRFTADDLVAVTFLSVNVPVRAAMLLLDRDADKFSERLTALGEDRDLVDEHDGWHDDWPGWDLWTQLNNLPGVGPTIASKLLARKRPRLRPIYDSVISRVIGSNQLWEPLRMLLRSNPDLHHQLVHLRSEAGLAEEISALRVFDVVAWMEGKHGPDYWGL